MEKFTEEAMVLENTEVAEKVHQLKLKCPKIAQAARPGQFITLPGEIWRRPFTVYDTDGSALDIVFRVVGRHTKEYAKLVPGQKISVIGPHGQPTMIENGVDAFILVAGGCGLAPLRYICHKTAMAAGKSIVIAGFPTIGSVFGLVDITDLVGLDNFLVATDDGSMGYQGNAAQYLHEILQPDNQRYPGCPYGRMAIYTCGPRPMMRAVSEIAAAHEIRCWALLEAKMACGGMGACKGCATETTNGFELVCENGPAFWSTEVIW